MIPTYQNSTFTTIAHYNLDRFKSFHHAVAIFSTARDRKIHLLEEKNNLLRKFTRLKLVLPTGKNSPAGKKIHLPKKLFAGKKFTRWEVLLPTGKKSPAWGKKYLLEKNSHAEKYFHLLEKIYLLDNYGRTILPLLLDNPCQLVLLILYTCWLLLEGVRVSWKKKVTKRTKKSVKCASWSYCSCTLAGCCCRWSFNCSLNLAKEQPSR